MSAPLIDKYRKMATFDWRKLKAAVEGEEHVRLKAEVVAKMKSEPIFHRDYRVLSREEHREVVHQRWKKIVEWGLFKDPYSDLENFHALTETLEAYDQGTSARLFLHGNVFGAAVKSMGTERHKELVEKIENNEVCISIRDSAHSHSATHVVVYAQLHVDGKNEGLHGFVIQVRCPRSFQTLPGITIGDMGSKPGCWQGVENGWMEFKNHRAPLSALLNKGCDITPDGKYVTSFKSASEKQSVSLGTLSVGRLGIIAKGMMACTFASTIAIRYSVARRQFGPEKGVENEVPVLEYPLQQYRLFPYLSAAICIRIFQKTFVERFTEYMMRVMMGEKSEELSEFSKEVHALSSGAKPVATWLGVESLGEARKACGGHGFLHMSRLNTLRDDNDPSQTFEGENFMILQQTSNILLGKVRSLGSIDTPMSTMSFLNKNPSKFSSWSSNPVDDVLSAYRYLAYHLLQMTASDANKLKNSGKNAFEVRNEIQVHRAVNLSIAYTEHTMIDWVQKFLEDVEDSTVKNVLQKVLNLFSLFLLERHLATLYITGYASGGKFGEELREKLRLAVAEIKPESMALVDSIAPDDFILHSALGASDGRAYDHIMEEFRKYTNEQPRWVCDLAQFLQKRSQHAKL
ncbi:hypothetical protein CAEBREN_26277 [Caenorhabditis brenneri]|uniref:Acyl-coenzyme A oxidase n=1 Tax=Caenorhabditis brenneri TaxID=135651 RepID=G0NW37_CAEBE|nr:hypothetical protein CAEBREN_26277 [Caenorhabditis brenneri]